MDAKTGGKEADGHAGVELSPHTRAEKHLSQPGLEVVDYSNLEVVSPRPGLSATGTWEKGSSVPQVTARNYPPLSASSEVGTPYSGVASSYEYMSPGGGGYAGGGGMVKDGFFREDAICGVKRQTFWIVMAIGVFVMVAAVAIGVGLGVALHPSAVPSAAPLPSANSSSPTTTTLPAPTATGATGPNVGISCPANNLTLYSATGTNKTYLLLCGRDYNSVDGAGDLFHEPMDSMSDCINGCSQQQGCVGVGWGVYYGQETCWYKNKLGAPNVTPNWFFAIEDEGALKGG